MIDQGKLVRCIQELQRMTKDTDDPTIHNALFYCKVLLEKINEREIIFEKYDYGTLRVNMYLPPEDIKMIGIENFAMAKIRASFQYELDKVLRNYEKAYQLEPFTQEDAEHLHESMNYYKGLPQLDNGSIEFRGYKIYKKKNGWIR